jgi:chemotaxis protein MotB
MHITARFAPLTLVAALAVSNLTACASKSQYEGAVARGDSLALVNAQLQAEYDSLQNLFASEIESAALDLELLRDGIEIELPSDLLFKSGSLEVDTDQGEFGPKFAEYLKGNEYLVFVTGYTDSQDPIGNLAQRYPTNWELSSARAALAVRYLAGEGVADHRLWVIGRAANDPVATNDTPEGRALNRRLRVIVRPVELVTNTQ